MKSIASVCPDTGKPILVCATTFEFYRALDNQLPIIANRTPDGKLAVTAIFDEDKHQFSPIDSMVAEMFGMQLKTEGPNKNVERLTNEQFELATGWKIEFTDGVDVGPKSAIAIRQARPDLCQITGVGGLRPDDEPVPHLAEAACKAEGVAQIKEIDEQEADRLKAEREALQVRDSGEETEETECDEAFVGDDDHA